MKCLSILIAACGIVMGCGEATGPQPLPPTFVVSGTVRDQAGLAVSGAIAEITDRPGAFVISNDTGYFGLSVVRGYSVVRVHKVGFSPYVRGLQVVADTMLDVTLEGERGDTIVLGRTIRSSVQPSAPACDPIGWNANAPCRRFGLTAPSSGEILITITLVGGSPLDAVVVSSREIYLATSSELNSLQVSLRLRVEAGAAYEVRVHSYYDGSDFDLLATLSPGTGSGS